MAKTYLRTILMVATSKNFSDLSFPGSELFDAGDEGSGQEVIYSQIQADIYLLNLLKNLNDRQKIILMYQLLREAGYNLNHADCAQTLSITRERYMVLLRDVKKRAAKILQGKYPLTVGKYE